MICATCNEYFRSGGCQHSSLSDDFETKAFCGTPCYIQFLSTQPCRKKNLTMNRSTDKGRLNLDMWSRI